VLITKTLKIKWSSKTRSWYKNKGYIYTKNGDEFTIKVDDLPNKSGVQVIVECDCITCTTPITKPINWRNYTRYVHEDGKYYCVRCTANLFGKEKSRITRLENSKSFHDWCYDNLQKEVADKILERWDYELNKISPKDITYSSNGINKKGYWFKCLDHSEHSSELKSIRDFVNHGHKGSIDCKQCNSISIVYPHLVKYFINKEDTVKYSAGSGEKLPMRCPDCGFEKEMIVNDLNYHGFYCNRCSDGVTYPEKFMLNILEQLLDKNFQVQLSKKTFKWCENYKYDNYIDKINCIIETHGLQHYRKENGKWGSLEKIQKNDKNKEELAKSNNIYNYIVIDCRKSEMEWIKNSIMNSKLPRLLNFKEEDINWLKAQEFACSSLVKIVCQNFSDGNKNTLMIADKFKLNRGTVTRYLKQGVELGWCDYDPKEARVRRMKAV